MDKKLIFEVEHEIAPIRHAYAICPGCGNKFAIEDFLSAVFVFTMT